MQLIKSSRFSPPDQVKIPSLAGLKMTKTPGIRAKTQRRKADSPDVSDTSVELDTKRKVQLPRKMKEIALILFSLVYGDTFDNCP